MPAIVPFVASKLGVRAFAAAATFLLQSGVGMSKPAS